MKTLKIAVVAVAFCILTTVVVAATQEKEVKVQARKTTAQDIQRPQMARSTMNREQAYKQNLAARMEQHQKGLNELEAIKKIAEDEQATRTVEALQSLIDQKDKAFKDSIVQFEKARRERVEKLEQRRKELETRKIDDDDDDKKEQPTAAPRKQK